MATTQTTSDITIRPMQVQDLDAVAVIENSAYFAPWPKVAIQASLSIYPAFVIEKNAQIVGYAIFSVVKDEAHIVNFVIAPQFQNQGLGRLLLQYVLHLLLAQQIKTITLEVSQNNASALHLYQVFGFQRCGLRKAYYQTAKGREDALILAYKPSYT